MSDHHENSPSALARRALCPGSRLMEEGEPDTTSKAAEEGTMLHSVVAARLRGDAEPEPQLTHEQQEIVEECLEYVELFPGLQFIEQPRRLIAPDGQLLTEGTPDLIIVNEGYAICIDWKFGRSDVSQAVDNLQIAAYAAMAWQACDVDQLTGIVYQPRAWPRVTDHLFTDFPAVVDYIASVCRRTFDDPVLVQGEHQCKYCKGAHKCPEYRGQVAKITATVERLPPLATMPADELAALVDQTSQIVRIHELVKSAIKGRIEQGVDVPGWRLKRGIKKRAADASELFGIVAETLSADEYAACCKVSLPSVEDAVAAKVGDNYKTKKAAKEYAKALVLPAVRETEGAKILERVK